jgi:hypothetical protein
MPNVRRKGGEQEEKVQSIMNQQAPALGSLIKRPYLVCRLGPGH